MIESLATKLNASSWRGCVSEVGVGIPFSAKYVSIPGASNTILHMDSPYAGIGRPDGMRAVSLENARRMAQENLVKAIGFAAQIAHSNQEHLFGLSITGAHYTDRKSHAWVYLATPGGDACMHFYTKWPIESRQDLGKLVIDYVSWFLYNCLIEKAWIKGITEMKPSIDVLYAAGVSDFERLLLLTEDNPLAWNSNGRLERVEDLVRGTSTVYSGSFNPPTKRHLQNAEGALCEISQKHPHKGDASVEDMLHRIRMLNAAGHGVLITKAPRFIDKYRLLQRYITTSPNNKILFKLGVDAWNNTIAAHQYPNGTWLGENMPHAKFIILPRAGYQSESSVAISNLDYVFVHGISSEESSTEIRDSSEPHKHKFLTPEVADYIYRNRLYKNFS